MVTSRKCKNFLAGIGRKGARDHHPERAILNHTEIPLDHNFGLTATTRVAVYNNRRAPRWSFTWAILIMSTFSGHRYRDCENQ